MDSFDEFFKAAHGKNAYKYQNQLGEEIPHDKDWFKKPRLLRSITGSGKTSIITIWLWWVYLYCRYGKQEIVRPPLKFWFVTPRQVIVHAAMTKGRELLEALDDKNRLFKAGRVIIKHLGLDDNPSKVERQPLRLHQIMGGDAKEDKNSWVAAPNQPTLICCTLQQFGSRLLCRGYDASEGERALQAGMTAIDSLICIDEGQLSGPLLKTIGTVLHMIEQSQYRKDFPPTNLMAMSATAETPKGFKDFVVKPEGDNLARLASAKRQVGLIGDKGSFEKAVKKAIHHCAKGLKVIAYLNNVPDVRKFYRACKKAGVKRICALTGQMRRHEQRRIIEKLKDDFRVETGWRPGDGRGCLLVTNQTAEVGADFDFDMVISQAAPLDVLIQRFGRQDRIGLLTEEIGKSIGFIFHHQSRGKRKYPPYENTCVEKTWEFLLKISHDGFIDHLLPQSLLTKDVIANCYDVPNQSVELTTGTIDTLFSTCTAGFDVSVDPYIVGAMIKDENDENDECLRINLVYRKDMCEEMMAEDPEQAIKWAKMLRPLNAEIIPVPAYFARKENAPYLNRLVVICRNGFFFVDRFCRTKGGDTVYAPAADLTIGSHDACGFNELSPGDKSKEKPGIVSDVFDQLQPARKGYSRVLRLHPTFFPGIPAIPNIREDQLLGRRRAWKYVKSLFHENFENKNLFLRIFHGTAGDNIKPKYLTNGKTQHIIKVTPDGLGFYLRTKKPYVGGTKGQTLQIHQHNVAYHMGRYAEKIGLPKMWTDLLIKVAQYHDIGKADVRWQEKMGKKDDEPLLAKPKTTAKKFPAIPDFRHELLSMSMLIENNLTGKILGDLEEHKNLFLFLTGQHHSKLRPLTLKADYTFCPSTFDREDGREKIAATRTYLDCDTCNIPDLLPEINARYGHWLVAYLEAIFHQADIAGSNGKKVKS